MFVLIRSQTSVLGCADLITTNSTVRLIDERATYSIRPRYAHCVQDCECNNTQRVIELNKNILTQDVDVPPLIAVIAGTGETLHMSQQEKSAFWIQFSEETSRV